MLATVVGAVDSRTPAFLLSMLVGFGGLNLLLVLDWTGLYWIPFHSNELALSWRLSLPKVPPLLSLILVVLRNHQNALRYESWRCIYHCRRGCCTGASNLLRYSTYGMVSLYRIESRKRFDSNRISSKALIGWLIGFPGTKATGPNTICEQPAAAATQITVTAVKPELVR